MAKTKKSGPKPMTPATRIQPEIKTKPVRLDFPPEIHQMLRVVAAESGMPMAVFARDVIAKRVRELYGDRKPVFKA